jgi:DNA-binding MarR family transcriptional regulator
MAPTPTEREALLLALNQAVRSFTNQVTFYSEAVAATVGIHPTDLDCLSLIAVEGSVTPGRLVDVTGLTSGAITGALDRLERGGYVRREPDPSDRRRVVVRPVDDALGSVAAAFVPMISASNVLAERYEDAELATIIDYVTRATPLLREETFRLRAGSLTEGASEQPDDVAEVALPGVGTREGTLRFVNGAARLTVVAEAGQRQLFTAQFRGGRPTTREEGDTVVVQYRRSPFAHFRTSGTITLDADRRWRVEVKGGIANSTFDLRDTTVDSVTVHGGVSSVDLHLPRPASITTVEVRGGMSAVTITRPSGVPARVTIRGGASNLVIDGQRFGAIGGHTDLRSAHPAGDTQLDIVLRGGASSVSVIDDRDR